MIGVSEVKKKSGIWRKASVIDSDKVTPEVTREVKLLLVFSGEMSRKSLQLALGLKDDEHFRQAYLLPALDKGLIEMTIPDKPKSSSQKYRLTSKGQKYLKDLEK